MPKSPARRMSIATRIGLRASGTGVMCLDAVGRAVRPLAALLVERESRGQFSDLGADALPEGRIIDMREHLGDPCGDAFHLRLPHAACGHRRTAETNAAAERDRKSTRLNSSHGYISYAVFCLKKK